MASNKKHGYYILDTGSAFSVEGMDGVPEELKSIISSVVSQLPHSTVRASVINVTPKSVTLEKNIRKSSEKPTNTYSQESTDQPKKTGGFLRRTLTSLLERSLKAVCTHEWVPDYEEYGWDKNGGATTKNTTPCKLPDELLSLKICKKCGEKKK